MLLLMHRRDGAKCRKEHTHQQYQKLVIASPAIIFLSSGMVRLTRNIPTVAYIVS